MEAALTVPAPTIARSRTTPPRTRRIAVLGADRSGGSRLSRLLALHPQLEPVDDPWTGGPGAWHRAAPEACVVLLEGDEARAAIAACRERDLPVIDLSGALDALGGPASETTRSGAPLLLAEVDPSARYVSLPPLRAAAVALTAGPLAMAGLFDPGATICVVASGPRAGTCRATRREPSN